jgi:tripartite-type tricarboxylate transporter receptor subunit TctC
MNKLKASTNPNKTILTYQLFKNPLLKFSSFKNVTYLQYPHLSGDKKMSLLTKAIAWVAISLPIFVSAQTYPIKPIRLVVPYAPGGAVDVLGRPVAQKLGELLGQSVIVDNKPGANATLGSDNIARSPADGYSILLTSVVHYLVPLFSKNVPYDAYKDFTPIAQIATTPNILAVHPTLPVNNVKEFIDYAHKYPDKLFYGTTGVGSTHHLAGVLLASTAKINLEHLPYKGGNPTINDALGGQIPVVILTAPTILPYAKQGRLKALAVIESKRSKTLPDLPAIGETVAGYAVPDLWLGVLGPVGLPKSIVEKLNSALRQSVNTLEVKQRLEASGFEVTGTQTVEEFNLSIKTDTDAFKKIVSNSGIKPE